MQQKASDSNQLFRGTHGGRTMRSSSSTSRLANGQPSPDSSDAFVAQFVRATSGDKLFDFVDNVQLLARIVNGIALQNGIVESAIPANDVIAELLRMGSMKPEKLVEMKTSDVTAVMDMMKKATGSLVQNDDVTDLEDHYLKLNSVIEANFDSDAFRNLLDRVQEYESALDKMNNVTTVSTTIKDTIDYATKLRNSLNEVKKFESDLKDSAKGIESRTLSSFNDTMVNVENSMNSFQPVFTLVGQLKDLKGKSSFVQLLTAEYEARKQHKAVSRSSQAEQEASNNFQLLDQMGTLFGNHQELLDMFNSFVETRQSGRQQGVQHSAGFPDGVKDLERLPADVTDKWFQTSARLSEKAARNLRKGLMALHGFSVSLRSVESAWKPALDNIDGVKGFIPQLLRIVVQSKSSPNRTNTLKSLNKCQNTNSPQTGTTLKDIEPALKLIEDLNQKVSQMSDFTIANQLKDLKVLRAAVDFTGRNTDELKEEVTPGMVGKLKAMPEVPTTIQLLDQFLNETKSLQNIVQDLSSQNIKGKMTSIVNYHNDTLKTKFLEWNDCLKKVGKEGELVAGVIRSIRSIRAMGSTQEIAQAEAFMNTILNSKNAIVSAQESAKNMKSLVEDEAEPFKLLTKDVSRRLGLAVQGLAEMRKAVESRNQLNALTGDVSYIQISATGVKHLLTPEQYQVLSKFESLRQVLNSNFAQIDAVKGSIGTLAASDLKSLAPVFQSATNMTSINVDPEELKRMVAVLAERDPSIQSKLAALNSSLDALHPLVVDFAVFNITEAPSALDELGVFFVKLAQSIVSSQTTVKIPPIAVSVAPPQNQRSVIAPTVSSPTVILITTTDGSNTVLIIVIIAAVISVIVLFIAGGFGTCKLLKKEEKDYEYLDTFDILLSKAMKLLRPLRNLVERVKKWREARKLANEFQLLLEAEEQALKKGAADDKNREKLTEYRARLTAVIDELNSMKKDMERDRLDDLSTILDNKLSEFLRIDDSEDKKQKAAEFKKYIVETKAELEESKKDDSRDPEIIDAQIRKLDEYDHTIERELENDEKMKQIQNEKREAEGKLNSMVKKKEDGLSELKRHMLTGFAATIQNADSCGELSKTCIGEILHAIVNRDRQANSHLFNTRDEKNKKRMRQTNYPCLECSAVKLNPYVANDTKEYYIHANTLVFADGREVVMCQGPLDGKEDVREGEEKKADTCPEHWMMIDQKNAELTIMLCNFVEDKKKKCAQYYPDIGEEMTAGVFKLKTTREVDVTKHFSVDNTKISLWEVEYTRLDGNKEITKKHNILRYFDWPDRGVPATVKQVLEIYRYWIDCKGVSIVHCSMGVGRTGTMVATRLGVQMCKQGGSPGVGLIHSFLRDKRYGVMPDIEQVAFLAVAVARIIVDEYPEIGFVECLPQWEFYLDQVKEKKYRSKKNGKDIYLKMKPEEYQADKEARKERVAAARLRWKAKEERRRANPNTAGTAKNAEDATANAAGTSKNASDPTANAAGTSKNAAGTSKNVAGTSKNAAGTSKNASDPTANAAGTSKNVANPTNNAAGSTAAPPKKTKSPKPSTK